MSLSACSARNAMDDVSSATLGSIQEFLSRFAMSATLDHCLVDASFAVAKALLKLITVENARNWRKIEMDVLASSI